MVRRSPRLVALNQRIEDGGATKESDDTARNKRSKVVKKKKVSNPDAKKRATQRDSSDRKGEGLRPTVEEKWWKKGFGIIAGVDEAGRGPLAGPVVAAACVVPPGVWFEGVGDSKQISLQARERLFAEITGHPLVTYHIAQVSEQEIDKINIREATKVAMRNAVVGLKEYPDHVMVDGNFVPELPPEIKSSEFIIKGDTKVFSIACASILAKVFRDRIMKGYEKAYPGYGLGQNKGYPTASHREALLKIGATPIHRLSFGPVVKAIALHGKPVGAKQTVKKRLPEQGGKGRKKIKT